MFPTSGYSERMSERMPRAIWACSPPHSRQARDETRTPNTTPSTPFVLLKEISLVCEVVVMNILFFGYLCDWECTTYSTVLNGEGIHKHKHNLDL